MNKLDRNDHKVMDVTSAITKVILMPIIWPVVLGNEVKELKEKVW